MTAECCQHSVVSEIHEREAALDHALCIRLGTVLNRPRPEVTGPVRWPRDRYGSRFAVTTADQPERWYLWDIDACGHQAFTVHSGYYPTPEAALIAWQTGVGPTAAAGTVLAPVDDPWLLTELLPAEEGLLRAGEENTEQFAEYHRSKRLAEAVKHVATTRNPTRSRDERGHRGGRVRHLAA